MFKNAREMRECIYPIIDNILNPEIKFTLETDFDTDSIKLVCRYQRRVVASMGLVDNEKILESAQEFCHNVNKEFDLFKEA